MHLAVSSSSLITAAIKQLLNIKPYPTKVHSAIHMYVYTALAASGTHQPSIGDLLGKFLFVQREDNESLSTNLLISHIAQENNTVCVQAKRNGGVYWV